MLLAGLPGAIGTLPGTTYSRFRWRRYVALWVRTLIALQTEASREESLRGRHTMIRGGSVHVLVQVRDIVAVIPYRAVESVFQSVAESVGGPPTGTRATGGAPPGTKSSPSATGDGRDRFQAGVDLKFQRRRRTMY